MGIVRLALLILSCYGWAQLLRNKAKAETEFICPILFAGIGTVMVVAGILNVLSAVAWAIFFGGLVAAIIAVKKRYPIKPLITSGTVIMAITLGILLFLTVGNRYTHYDNFSHWATVLRQIVRTDSFPNFDDTDIIFQAYPLGSAATLYYFVKVTGFDSEWFSLFVQQILTVGMLCSVFAFFKTHKVLTAVFGVAGMLCFLFADVGYTVTHDLLIDILLSATAVAATAVVLYYRREIPRYALVIGALVAYMVALKNSGILFAAAVCVYALYATVRHNGAKTLISYSSLILVGTPLLTVWLWNRHVAYVFAQGLDSKHAFSFDYYDKMFGEKGEELIAQIGKQFLKRFFTAENTVWLVLLVFLLVAVIMMVRKARLPVVWECLAMAVGVLVAWIVGMYFTYCYSMEQVEALSLDGFDRYLQTGMLFCFGLIWIMVGNFLSQFDGSTRNRIRAIALLLITVCLCGITLKTDIRHHDGKEYSPLYREQFEEAIAGQPLPKDGTGKYVVIWHDGAYYSFLSRFVLNPARFSYCEYRNLNKLSSLEGYDYVIVPLHTQEVDSFLQKMFGNDDRTVYALK